MGRKLTKEEKRQKNILKNLIKRLRKSNKYINWKNKILKRDVPSYPKIPKGVQVHHLKEISHWIYEYKIKSVMEAIHCKPLWKLDVGISLKRGEHFIWTKLGRYKYLTKGFRALLEDWLERAQLDKLDANQKRRKKRCSK